MLMKLFDVSDTLFIGIRSGSSAAVRLMASPEPAVVADGSLISVQYPKNLISNDGDVSGPWYQSMYRSSLTSFFFLS